MRESSVSVIGMVKSKIVKEINVDATEEHAT